MIIRYYGHSCFTIESSGYKIALDPFTGVRGFSELSITANEVFCSHEHFDHNYIQAVEIEKTKDGSSFDITEIQSFHDPEEGRLRGSNTIRIFEAEGMRIAHFGDIGCRPTLKQMELLGNLDLALIPVGGTYTLDAAEEKALMDEIRPRVIIPMHYRLGKYNFENIAELGDFTKLYKEEDVTYAESVLELNKDMHGVYVMKWE